jgi:hypothetical protein
MIINSNYHDYYDGVVKSTGVDKSMVFNRDELDINFNDCKNLFSDELIEKLIYLREEVNSSWSTEKNHSYQCIVFCGKVYWLTSIKNPDYVHDYHHPEKNNISVTWEQSENRNISRHGWKSESVSSDVTTQWDLRELCISLKSSIILISGTINQHRISGSSMIFSLYPKLKSYNFQRLVDPYTAYQELQMFNFGVLSNNPEPQILNDKSRIVAAGFDLKSSFRKVK